MEQALLFYIMLMTVSIGILLKLLGNGLWMFEERDSVWNAWYMYIGSCQSDFLKMKYHSILVHQARYATSVVANYLYTATVKTSKTFMRPILHIILSLQNLMHLTVMIKFRSWLGSSTFTTKLLLGHWFICHLKEWIWVFQYTS